MSTVFDPIQSTGLTPGLLKYRRPVLQWQSSTQVNVQDQIVTGIAGDCTILFTDGKLLTVNSSLQTQFIITRNASLSGTKQSGLRTGSAANNTWYALYAVRATDNDNTWVTVGDTVYPVNSSISTLNTNFGSNKWVYIGLIRYGDQSGSPNSIVKFWQSGNMTIFQNVGLVNVSGGATGGILLAGNNTATVTWAYASGSTGAVLPSNVTLANFLAGTSSSANTEWSVRDSIPSSHYARQSILSGNRAYVSFWVAAAGGVSSTNSNFGSGQDVILYGWIDDALGVGSNPLV